MKVSELIEQLKKCHPDDNVEVSLTTDDNHYFGGIIEVNEIKAHRIGNVTLIADVGERYISTNKISGEV